LIGLLALRYLDFPTFVVANLIVDWRAALFFLGLWPFGGTLHSWPSTYPGALLSGLLLASVMIYARPFMDNSLREMKIVQDVSKQKIFASAVLGVLLHVTLDAFHHPNIQPFIIEGFRPFFGFMTTSQVRMLCLGSLVLCFPVYVLHVTGKINLAQS
jgi:hypothetical protein